MTESHIKRLYCRISANLFAGHIHLRDVKKRLLLDLH